MIEEKEVNKSATDIAKDMFTDWLTDLEEKDQPDTCFIDDDDCEACGS